MPLTHPQQGTAIPRIGYDASFIFGKGGIERYSREIVRGMAERSDVELTLICRSKHGAELDALIGAAKGIRLDGYPHNLALGLQLERVTKLVQHRWWRRLGAACDMVHLTGHHFTPPLRTPYVATVHDVFPITMPQLVASRDRQRVHNAIMHQLQTAAAIVVPSAYTAAAIVELVADAQERITVTPLAAGPEFVPAPLVQEVPTFLWYGRADDRKNVPGMLRAYGRLPREVRRRVGFTVAMGGVARLRDEFAQHNAALLSVEGVRFVEALSFSNLIATMQHCYALLFCSTEEGFGLPVIEAMQCGCPVLTSNTTSLPEVGGDAVLYASPFNEEEMAQQMERLATDDDLRGELRRRGLARAREFSWQRTVDATAAAYHRVLAT
jgi:alpha-1,3-rhamnosyl/mannosyltransferase